MGHERVRTVLAAAAMMSVLGCDAPTVPRETFAYDPTQLTGGKLYHWALGTTIAVYVDPGGQSASRELTAAVRAAAAVWERAVYYREFRLRLVDVPGDADVIVHVVATPALITPPTGCPSFGSAAGVTYFCVDGADRFVVLPFVSGSTSRVRMDVRVDPSRLLAGQTLEALVAHEIGHVLGIGSHSPDVEDLMFVAPRVAAPSAADARTLRVLLHEPSELVL